MAIHHTSVLLGLRGRHAVAAAPHPDTTQQQERHHDRGHGRQALAGLASVIALHDLASSCAAEPVEDQRCRS